MSWPEADRRRVLAMPRLGQQSLDRLEAVGIDSIEALRDVGVEQAVERVCRRLGSAAWRNRRRALERLVRPRPPEPG